MRRIPLIGSTLLMIGSALLVLLVPSLARAGDDPPAPNWPRVQGPGTGSDADDPVPANWPKVRPPTANDATSDPRPPTWPGPTPR